MKILDRAPQGGCEFDPFFVPDDWARLQYGRMLWKLPAFRKRLLDHWMDARHPYRDRFASRYRDSVERLLESDPADDETLERELRAQGESLRTVMREIPPVFGDFF